MTLERWTTGIAHVDVAPRMAARADREETRCASRTFVRDVLPTPKETARVP